MNPNTSAEEALRQLLYSRYDHNAWNTLLSHLRPFLVAVAARNLSGDIDLAEDAVQETSSRLYEHAPVEQLQTLGAFKAYATKVCINACNDLNKRRGVGSETSGTQQSDVPEAANGYSPDSSMISEELLQQVRSQLTDAERMVFDRHLRGYKLSEIAEALGITYVNAAKRLSRIRKRLREEIG